MRAQRLESKVEGSKRDFGLPPYLDVSSFLEWYLLAGDCLFVCLLFSFFQRRSFPRILFLARVLLFRMLVHWH